MKQFNVSPFLLALANWAYEAQSMQSPREYKMFLARILKNYLLSEFADDRENRTEAIVVFDHLENLMDILHRHNNDFDDLYRWMVQQRTSPDVKAG